MTTAVAIANLALSHLGDDATVSSIDPPEGSQQAEHCAMFYPIARDALLELHPWGFATRRGVLALVAAEPNTQWGYAYALPSNVLGVFAVQSADSPDDFSYLGQDQGNDYEIESDDNGNRVLYTDVVDAHFRYTVSVSDTSKFPPLFTTALSFMLASYVAGPLLKGETGRTVAQAMMGQALGWVSQAKLADAKQRRAKRVTQDHVAPWIAAR